MALERCSNRNRVLYACCSCAGSVDTCWFGFGVHMKFIAKQLNFTAGERNSFEYSSAILL
jgi:hypothetical protein